MSGVTETLSGKKSKLPKIKDCPFCGRPGKTWHYDSLIALIDDEQEGRESGFLFDEFTKAKESLILSRTFFITALKLEFDMMEQMSDDPIL